MIESIYNKLHDQNICDSAYDFSVRFLGKSRSYYSVLKTRNVQPSIEAISTLEVALKNTSNLFSDRHPVLTKTRITLQDLAVDVGQYREQLSNEILSQHTC